MTVTGLIEALHRAGVRPTARELAEALWLARYLTVTPAVTPGSADAPAGAPEGDRIDPPAAEPRSRTEEVPVAVPARSPDAVPVAAFPVRSPAPPGLPDPRRLQRALRPLRRRVPSVRRSVLDESATARFIAATGVWAPVLKPAPERRFEAVLAVDTAPSMAVWRQLEADVAVLLHRSGAFRDVRVCRLDGSAAGIVIRAGGSGAPVRPAQLIDGARRRIFLLLTDAVGARWHDGSAARQLAGWARTGPMAVLQPLPEQLWSRTGLPGRAARITAPGSGVPNSALSVRLRRGRAGAGIPVPVLGLAPAAWRSWASVVAARTGDVPLAVAVLNPSPTDPGPAREDPDGSAVQRFRATASPPAYQLAVCLSAVPLTLDTMRLVQHAVVGAPPSALAEVLLGGLLVRTGAEAYDFADGVRDELLDELRRSEADRVLTVMSSYLAAHAGAAGPSFPALSPGPDGYLRTSADTFAWIPSVAAERLGLRPATTPVPRSGRIRHVLLLVPPDLDTHRLAEELGTRLDVPAVDFGDHIRGEIARKTPFGEQAGRYVKGKVPVPDPLVLDEMTELLQYLQIAGGFVLSGYPRTLAQARHLDMLLTVDLVLHLTPAGAAGRDRIEVLNHYREQHKVVDLDATGTARDVIARALAVLRTSPEADLPSVADEPFSVLPVQRLQVRRTGDDLTVSWIWPDRIEVAEVLFLADDESATRRQVSRSEVTSTGYRILARTRGGQVMVRSVVPRPGGDLLSAPETVTVEPVTTLTYEFFRTGLWRNRGRRGLRVTVDRPCDDVELHLVAAAGTILPNRPESGRTLMRFTGLRLVPGTPWEVPFTVPKLTKPYWLRCFVVGPDGIRVVEPPFADLRY